MTPKERYQAAIAFRDAKLWAALRDQDLYAVRFADGEIGYCSVMGMDGEHFALGLYMGALGLSTLGSIASPDASSPLKAMEAMFSQGCLMCSFENKGELDNDDRADVSASGLKISGRKAWPQFRKYEPFKYPWNIKSEKDWNRIVTALRAGAAIGGRLPEGLNAVGFSDGKLPVLTPNGEGFDFSVEPFPELPGSAYHMPRLGDELEIARFSKLKKARRELVVDVAMLPMPVDGEPPEFPVALIAATGFGQPLACLGVVTDYGANPTQLAQALLDDFLEHGKPARLLACSERAYYLFSAVCEQIGVNVEISEEEFGAVDLLAEMMRFTEGMNEEEEPAPRRRAKRPAKAASAPPESQPKPKPGQSRPGKCEYCGQTFAKAGMLRHIKTCASRPAISGQQQYFTLRVEAKDDPDYYLYLDVMSDTTLNKLDEYLRGVWLECCGHLSAFFINGEEYFSHPMEYGEMGMSAKLERLVSEGDSFSHEYDFGSTTELRITVCASRTSPRRRAKIALIARNLSPAYACASCGAPATTVCAICRDPFESPASAAYCDACAPAHDCGDEAFLPLPNSPRAGVCAYGADLGGEE